MLISSRPPVCVCLLLFPILLCCTPSDDERCVSGFYFDDNACYREEDTSETSTTDGGSQVDPDGGFDLPTGLGAKCDNDTDCAEYDADYCAVDPTDMQEQGVCTIQDCHLDPTICPAETDLICCDFEMFSSIPSICITRDRYDIYADIVGC